MQILKTSTSFLGEFYNSKGDFWTAVVKVNDNDTRFKLDTGVVVSIVSDRELWLKDQQLSNTQQILRGPGGTILSVIGTFNEFSQGRMRFLGHIVDAQGVHADPEKTRAIAQFPAPSTATELQRFFGMVTQQGKFIPRLADLNEPLRQLLRKETEWYRGEVQQTAFQRVKEILVSTEVLARYDPTLQTFIAAGTSSTGLRVVLLQTQDNGQRRPICYI